MKLDTSNKSEFTFIIYSYDLMQMTHTVVGRSVLIIELLFLFYKYDSLMVCDTWNTCDRFMMYKKYVRIILNQVKQNQKE